MKKRCLFMLTGAAAIAGADQLTKYLTVRKIPLHAEMPLWPGVAHLTYLRNAGMAFSLFEGGRWVFLALTAAFLVFAVLASARDWFPHPLGRTALTMLTGGAVGNLIDRLLYGSVVDMIELEFIHFAVFNVADIFVTVGAGLILIWVLFFDRKKPAARTANETDHDDYL